jgi:hypothetical protein
MSREIAIERAASHSVPKTYETLAKHPHIQLLAREVKKGRRR